MMPVALNRMSRSAEAMGPFGLRTPSLQPPSVAAPITTRASRADRILDLLCPETGGTARGADQQLGAATACTTAGAQPRACCVDDHRVPTLLAKSAASRSD